MNRKRSPNGRLWPILVAVVLLIGLVACRGSAPSTSIVGATASLATTSAVTLETAATTLVVTSTTLAPDAAPPELAGTWKIDIGQGVTDRLTLRGNSYSWSFGAGGRISVNGDIIEFSDAINQADCPGSGRYRWEIEGDILTFTLLESGDDCNVRQSHFAGGKEYSR
ncbi:MAG TPA: hypothetical protein VJ815_03480 [Acidimicrobiia bacterium]|nr:hypothetical protein [Acidimicrobiia bacterium]